MRNVLRKTRLLHTLFFFLTAVFLGACTNDKESQGPTLADIDVSSIESTTTKSTVSKAKSREEVRRAYRQYVENAPSQDSSRQAALTRLAQLELELSNSMSKLGTDTDIPRTSAPLKRTIALLETTLRDYPDAADNDKVLYQLAQAYDRSGQYANSIDRLTQLVAKYPRSPYYPEAQFRLAESAFARGDYITAEDAYTEVILTPTSEKFYAKSRFKRGWTRYKQQLYREAIDDYISTINQHPSHDYNALSDADKAQFDEYLRAVALAFSYIGEKNAVRNYFAKLPDFPFVYQIYDVIGDLYLAQERYSDAARVYEEYISVNASSSNAPLADIKIIESWREAGFSSRAYASIEDFYTKYRPNAAYWQNTANEAAYKTTLARLREYIIQVSSYFHERYRDRNKRDDFLQAELWYKRYLEDFTSHANQDDVYALFAELLLEGNSKQRALDYFKLAAYDGDIILDKNAAYTTVALSGELIDESRDSDTRARWLTQHLVFAQRYVALYPNEERAATIALSAAQRAYKAQRYEVAIQLANGVPDSTDDNTRYAINTLKARSLLEQQQFADAEIVYLGLLESRAAKQGAVREIRDSVALAIYRQGEMAGSNNQLDLALNHFTRIAKVSPNSQLAATGLFDAVALSMKNQAWTQAIGLIEEFKRRYPKHEKMSDISRSLSVAYLNSDQQDKAAVEFERIAQIEDNVEVKMAALWQAAELYEKKNRLDEAIRAYREYAHTYKTPFEQNIEAMYRLTSLYAKTKDVQKRYFWQNRIRQADQNATKGSKTDRTMYIASTTALDLARQKKTEFRKQRLIEPIAQNLKLKKRAMQDSVQLFGQASSYGVQEITTEATNAIGDIYFEFSKSLLASERPKNLSAEELEQYEILLEDQAFPFEEKAIEFYEVNLARTQDGTFDQYIQQSFDQLITLFPVRYRREGKTRVLDL